MRELDFSGKEQLYYQLYNILFQDIVNGVYSVGDLIPSETELMGQYGTSRITARKAMEMLANDGLIQKRRGYGSKVISNYPNISPSRAASYIRKSEDDKVPPEKRVIESHIIPADKEVATALNLAEGTPVFNLERVRFSGEKAYYIEANYLEEKLVPDAINRDFSEESLRVYLRDVSHVRWAYMTEKIFSVTADARRAELLGISEGSPLLYVRRHSFDTSERPREFVRAYFRADLYHLEITMNM